MLICCLFFHSNWRSRQTHTHTRMSTRRRDLEKEFLVFNELSFQKNINYIVAFCRHAPLNRHESKGDKNERRRRRKIMKRKTTEIIIAFEKYPKIQTQYKWEKEAKSIQNENTASSFALCVVCEWRRELALLAISFIFHLFGDSFVNELIKFRSLCEWGACRNGIFKIGMSKS